MANELVANIVPRSLTRQNGPISMLDFATVNGVEGVRLLKSDVKGFFYLVRIPAGITVGTGYTVKLLVVDDGKTATDPGLAVRLGINFKTLATGTDTLDFTSGAGTETAANLTLTATAGVVTESSLAITKANADGLDAAGWGLLQIRRIGTNAGDTATGTVLLLGAHILNT